MQFVYPQFLWALFSLLIPVLIHLLNLQRSRKVYFTNLEFLKEVNESTKRKFQLKRLLILIVRMLALAFLVLAFAQPYIPNESSGLSNKNKLVSVYLDNSFSMENDIGNTRAFDQGVVFAEEIVNIYDDNTRYKLVSNDFTSAGSFFKDKVVTLDQLGSITYSNGSKPATQIFKRLKMKSEDEADKNHDIFYISDFQKSTSGTLDRIKLDSVRNYFILPVSNSGVNNLYIDSVWLKAPYLRKSQPEVLFARIRNDGLDDVTSTNIKFVINDQQVSSVATNVKGKSTAEIKFTFQVNKAGINKCKLSFEDYPVTFDNEYFFTLRALSTVRVAVISNQKPSFPSIVFQEDSLFDLRRMSFDNIDYTSLNTFDIVIVEGAQGSLESLKEALVRTLESGSSVMLFPPAGDGRAYKELCQSLNIQLTGSGDTSASKNASTLFAPDPNDPFFKNVFEEVQANMDMPYMKSAVRLSRTTDALLIRKDNSPALVAKNRINGKVYAWCAPLDNRYTNVHFHSIFVPIMIRASLLSTQRNERLAFSFNEPNITIKGNFSPGDIPFSLGNGKSELLSSISLKDRLVFDLPDGEVEPGYFDIRQGETYLGSVAINRGKTESKMDFYTKSELEAAFSEYPNVTIIEASDQIDLKKKFDVLGDGVPLWKKCLILCLAFLLVEIALIRLKK